jgi:cadherin-like protein
MVVSSTKLQITINLLPVNDAPVPLNDTYATSEETPVILYVDVYDESDVTDLTLRCGCSTSR